MKTTMVIAESHGLLRDLLALAVSSEAQMQVSSLCASGREVLAFCEKNAPDVLLIGCALEDMTGVSLLKKMHADHPETRVLMLTGEGNGEVLTLPIQEQPHGIFHRNDPLPVFYEVLRAVARGARYHSERVIRHANGGGHNGKTPHVKLTEREREVLVLLARGRSSKQIAHDLKLSPKTVDHYRADLMKKLDIHDVAGLTRHALKAGLVTLE
ncbi:MAG: response regulator transcription factor [Verrucomicrobiaceae bacterium]|nr:response regulator transcription factor [Verrucomicrobiaceae bacterium]